MEVNKMSRPRYESEEKIWSPKTRLGLMVSAGKITSLFEIFENGWKIKEAEIVKTLLPDIKSEVVSAGIVQKQTDAGEMTRFVAIVAVGDGHGWFGIGRGKAPQMRNAIEKATNNALLNIIPVKIGCGSWECKCGRTHSIPYKTSGKGGSVKVELIPGPRGLGLVAGESIRNLLALAGVEDVWTRTFGSTSTSSSVAYAVYDALRKVHGISEIVE
jgi:small subunit ribosomal protein S5